MNEREQIVKWLRLQAATYRSQQGDHTPIGLFATLWLHMDARVLDNVADRIERGEHAQ